MGQVGALCVTPLSCSLPADAPVSKPTQLIRGELHGSVTVLCPSGDTQRDQKRFWCKVGRSSCTLLASSDGFVSRRYQGRIVISPQESSGAFRVLINDLKKEDSGLYLCGTRGLRGQDSLQEVVLQGKVVVHGVLGGSVVVKCFYPPTPVNRHDRKYWCRQVGARCATKVSSVYVDPAYQGRISLSDHPEAENFQINISALALSDAGTYQCGVGVNAPPVPEAAELFYVKLHSTWTVSCSFGKDTADQRRYLCKKEEEGCRDIINSHKEIDPDFTGRALLTFEEPPGSFRVTMTQMDWEDRGLYYCGVGEYGKNEKMKELDVFVYEGELFPGCFPLPLSFSSEASPAVSLYLKSSSRIWCKWRIQGCDKIIDNAGYVKEGYEGRVAMFENPGNKTVTIVLNQLQTRDQGFYWCMSNDPDVLFALTGEPALTGDKEVDAQAGSRVNLTCSYPCKYYSLEKYWCRWNESGCAVLPAQDLGLPGPGTSCATSTRTVVLSFDPVQKEDAGWYWCGVKQNRVLGETMAVELRVSEGESGQPGIFLLLSPDLVSVGSYRTNISMSDFENVRDLSACNSAKEIQETPVGGDGEWPSPAQPCQVETPHKGSKEDAELTYSSFLATSESIAQGGSVGDSAVLDVSPPQDRL
uniref:Polymeric immunoglobulin receptor n=1 Tax=Catharus ustulatus TaxID=91951 RepID=A0A8C3Y8K8_CATUS